MGTNQQFSLRWNNYLRHITCAFDTLRSDEDLVDVTLSCEGKRIRAHKMLLSACSTYFRDLFKENPCQHPVIIFRNVKFEDLSALIDFMYQGEVNVVQDQLASFLTTAELLAVQGLSDGTAKENEDDSVKEVELPDSPVIPTEPEVQMSNNHEPKAHHSSTPSYNAAPPSSPKFYPTDQRAGTPPPKRRKWASSAGSSSKSSVVTAAQAPAPEKERERDLRRVSAPPPPPRRESPEPVEIIPVVPHLKLEMPDYIEEQDASSCSYGGGDSSQGGGSRGDPLPLMAQLLGHSDTENKDTLDLYSSNSREASLPVPESLTASDPNLMLGKPGPSGESSSQGQDSLQGFTGTFSKTVPVIISENGEKQYVCELCGKLFKHPYSVRQHYKTHTGETKCPICHMVMSRKYELRVHLRKRHNVLQ